MTSEELNAAIEGIKTCAQGWTLPVVEEQQSYFSVPDAPEPRELHILLMQLHRKIEAESGQSSLFWKTVLRCLLPVPEGNPGISEFRLYPSYHDDGFDSEFFDANLSKLKKYAYPQGSFYVRGFLDDSGVFWVRYANVLEWKEMQIR